MLNCIVATKVLELNLAKEDHFLYLNKPYTNRLIKDLLIYERVENDEKSYDTVHLHKQIAETLDLYLQLDHVIFFKVNTDIDQKIFKKLSNLKKNILKKLYNYQEKVSRV
ncbi:24461_t:CDS:1 [Gigaspora margarita]|uniref:24461_t:CDS:1 n=1 Tax=Gigaspora margarita TaxID=4874 RepID=A0ABN7UNI4_GIGMA|nr:24461_t:CDS:1 [Gigaspora margarita]